MEAIIHPRPLHVGTCVFCSGSVALFLWTKSIPHGRTEAAFPKGGGSLWEGEIDSQEECAPKHSEAEDISFTLYSISYSIPKTHLIKGARNYPA